MAFSVFGGVAEWSIAPVLKTGVPQGTVSSNPTASANIVVIHRFIGNLNPYSLD